MNESRPPGRPAPTPIERVVWPLAVLAVVVIFIVWIMNPPQFPSTPGYSRRARLGPPVFASLVVLAGAFMAAGWSRNRNLARAARLRYRVCPACRRDLTADPPSGTCTRCGAAYDPGSVRSIWMRHGPAAPRPR